MKAVSIRLDDQGLDNALKRVRAGQELGFRLFDLCVMSPQLAFGRIVSGLKEKGVRLSALSLQDERRQAMIQRHAGYSKLASLNDPLRERSVEMVAETAIALSELTPEFLVLDGGFIDVTDLPSRHAILDDALTDRREIEPPNVDESHAEQQMEALCRSLHSLTKALEGLSICLRTPNSPFGLLQMHRMDAVLAEFPQVGYWHCTAGAELLERAGGPNAREWIDGFSSRLRGVYLSDSLGAHGEQAPGLGEIDFAELASDFGASVVRVLVVDDPSGTKLRFSTDYLERMGVF